MESRPLRILLVEDNPGDAELVEEMLQDIDIPMDIDIVNDGDQAIQTLGRATADHSLPDLILLDLNLPKKNGHEVLEFIRKHERIADTFVVVYSGSSSPEDMQRAQENKANGYLIKPMSTGEMEETTRRLEGMLRSIDSGSYYLLLPQII